MWFNNRTYLRHQFFLCLLWARYNLDKIEPSVSLSLSQIPRWWWTTARRTLFCILPWWFGLNSYTWLSIIFRWVSTISCEFPVENYTWGRRFVMNLPDWWQHVFLRYTGWFRRRLSVWILSYISKTQFKEYFFKCA